MTHRTHRAYPYAFCLSLAYELKDGILFMEYQVENRDQRDMWYAIGAHPDLTVPWRKALPLRITSWYLKGRKHRQHPLRFGAAALSPSKPGTRLRGRTLSLKREMFKNDAVFFDKLNSRAVSILNPATGHGVEVEFPGFETVAFWTLYPEPAPYLCVEPWNGSGIYENEGRPALP